MGGLIKERQSYTKEFLPGIDLLTRRREVRKIKTELLIFITPYIINSDEDLRLISDKKLIGSFVEAIDPIKKRKFLGKTSLKTKKAKQKADKKKQKTKKVRKKSKK